MTKKLMILALVILTSASFSTASAKDKKDKKNATVVAEPQRPQPTTATDSLSYAAGMAITNGLLPYLQQQFGITPAQMPDFLRGFNEAASHRNDSTFRAYSAGLQIADMLKNRMIPNLNNELDAVSEDFVFDGFAASLQKNYSIYTDSAAQKIFEDARLATINKRNEAYKQEGERFLAENKTKPGVQTTASGLQYKVLKAGNGPVPTINDKVEVIYEGKTLDGKVFDATSKHGTKSDKFGVGGLIQGWTEALTMMPVGSKWELYIPQQLAYGERGAGQNIKPYSALIFTLELLGIETPATKAEPAAQKAAKAAVKKTPAAKKKK